MAKSSNFIYDVRGIPYFHIRIVDDSFRVIHQAIKRDIGQKWYIHKKSRRAYLMPSKALMIKKGSKTEITFNYHNGMPLIPDETSEEQKGIIAEIKKDYQNILSKFNNEFIDTNLGKNGDIKKVVHKPITYSNKMVEPVFLYEALKSKFIPDILQEPKNSFEELIPLLIVVIVVVGVVAAAYLLTSQPHIITVPSGV